MNGSTRRTACGWVIVTLALLVWFAAGAWAQTAETQPAPGASSGVSGAKAGRMTGDNVYVRSGPHLNYYPVTKLNRGDPLTVVGEQYGWYEILPPEGTYSLVDKTYVDRSGDKGVLNGTTWVTAGSNFDDRKYAKQVKLQRGDEVRILAEVDDFYKISPPKGAHLWVKSDFVDVGGASVPKSGDSDRIIEIVPPGQALTGDGPGGTSSTTTRPSGSGVGGSGIVFRNGDPAEPIAPPPQPLATRPATAQLGKYQMQISVIEAEIEAEALSPPGQRDYSPMISKLQPIAAQEEDEVSSLYAEARIAQLEQFAKVREAVNRVRELTESALKDANAIRQGRSPLDPVRIEPVDEIAVRGEIRVSNLYEGMAGRPRRWRVVEPGSGYSAKTLAYIEVPPGSPIDPVQYYGKYVGIRASDRRMMKAGVQPMPVYMVQEIVVLDPESRSRNRSGAGSAMASPSPRIVAVPGSQPATTGDGADAEEQP